MHVELDMFSAFVFQAMSESQYKTAPPILSTSMQDKNIVSRSQRCELLIMYYYILECLINK